MKKTLLTIVLSILLSISFTLASILILLPNRPIQAVNNSPTDIKQESTNNYQDYENTVIDVVNRSMPAVVSIVVTKDMPIWEKSYDNYNTSRGFVIRVPRLTEAGSEKVNIGGGSGFLVSSDGYIITNKHVVDLENVEYTVVMNDGSKHPVQSIVKDPVSDIAVLKITGENLPFLNFGNSDQLKVGQTAITIGTPLAKFTNSVSVGVVSGLERSITAGIQNRSSEKLQGVIQTDAAINPGNSGGPLINLQGEVIGVNVAVANAENIGFSIPANLVKQIFESTKNQPTSIQ